MSSQVYGIGGLVSVGPSALSGFGPPAASFVGLLSQSYYDISVVPAQQYIYNGTTWSSGTGTYATTTSPGIVQLSADVIADQASVTLVPYAKAVYDYGQSLVIGGGNIAQTTVTGITNLATDAQAVAGTATIPGVTALAVQPSNLIAVFASPFPIGATAPETGAFTTLEGTTAHFTGLITGDASATINTGVTTLNLAADASTGDVNIATNGVRQINLGNLSGATTLAIQAGSGGASIQTSAAGDINFISDGATNTFGNAGVDIESAAGTITLGQQNSTGAINIGTGGNRNIVIGNGTSATAVTVLAGTGGVQVGSNAIAHPVAVGSTTGNSSLTLNSGTGNINIGTSISKNILVGNNTGSTAITMTTGNTGRFTVNTGNSGMFFNSGFGPINIGTDNFQHDITIGNQTDDSSLLLQAGGGGMRLVSGVSYNLNNISTARSPYNLQNQDYFLACDSTGGPITINLTLTGPVFPGRTVIVWDVAGTAGASNITVTGVGRFVTKPGSRAASQTIATNWSGFILFDNGVDWNILNQ